MNLKEVKKKKKVKTRCFFYPIKLAKIKNIITLPNTEKGVETDFHIL